MEKAKSEEEREKKALEEVQVTSLKSPVDELQEEKEGVKQELTSLKTL